MAKRSKLYKSQLAGYERSIFYSLAESLELLKKMPQVKFDQSVDISCKLGIDPRQGDQVVRGAIPLPHGTGSSVRVAVVAEGDAAEAARNAGADEVGSDDLIERIKGGWLDFDTLIATPGAMAKVRMLGRQLGPRGLMPNPKTGTVTDDTDRAVREAKAGRVEFRADKTACCHVPVGKLSFSVEALTDNVKAVMDALQRAKPASAKGVYLVSCTVSATMSPGVKLDTRQFTGG
jgi:large subunit ribosomal protein L1